MQLEYLASFTLTWTSLLKGWGKLPKQLLKVNGITQLLFSGWVQNMCNLVYLKRFGSGKIFLFHKVFFLLSDCISKFLFVCLFTKWRDHCQCALPLQCSLIIIICHVQQLLPLLASAIEITIDLYLWLYEVYSELKYIWKGLSSTNLNVLPWISFEGTRLAERAGLT